MSKKIPITKQKHNEVLKMIHSVSKTSSRFISELEALNPSWDNKSDGRILFYQFIREESQSYFLSQALSKKMLDTDWWTENKLGNSFTGNKEYDNKFLADRLYNYNESIKFGFFIVIYHQFESFFRLIAEKYDRGSCKDYSISKVVENLCLKLNFGKEFLSIWKIYAYTRNTIHSDGFHTKNDIEINHKNKKFQFKQNHPIDFVNLENLIYIVTECLHVTYNIINHRDIKSISEITHKASEVKFE